MGKGHLSRQRPGPVNVKLDLDPFFSIMYSLRSENPIIMKKTELLAGGRLLLIAVLFFFNTNLCAQHDSLVLKNGNVIVGEIKSLDKGVLTIETDYSKSDFTIEWSGIREIFSTSLFLLRQIRIHWFTPTSPLIKGSKPCHTTNPDKW